MKLIGFCVLARPSKILTASTTVNHLECVITMRWEIGAKFAYILDKRPHVQEQRIERRF